MEIFFFCFGHLIIQLTRFTSFRQYNENIAFSVEQKLEICAASFIAMLAVMIAFIVMLMSAAASFAVFMVVFMFMVMVVVVPRLIQLERIAAYPAHSGAVCAVGMCKLIPAAEPYLGKKGRVSACIHKAGIAEYLHANALAVFFDIADKRHIAGHFNVLGADAEIVFL